MFHVVSGRTLLAVAFTALGLIVPVFPAAAQPGSERIEGDVSGIILSPQDGGAATNLRLSSGAVQVSRLQGVNSPDRDNTPIVSADGTMMFFNSTRQGGRSWARFNPYKNRYDEDIYFAFRNVMRRDEEIWGDPINLGVAINSSEDDGVVSISPDGQALYYNSLKPGWEQDGGPFYHAKLSGNEWVQATGLGGGIAEFFADRDRTLGFRIYGGSISSDGNDFYFATTLYSSMGTHQIWVSHRKGGNWTYPESLGSRINDGSGSYAPFIAADGKTLFFTASPAGGYGGDDIYVSAWKEGTWTTPINLGSPINTEQDNAFLSIPASGDRVYFSVTSGNDEDIYIAPLPKMMRPETVMLVAGKVMDKATGRPVEATIVIEDLETGEMIFKANSNAANGSYTTVLKAGRDYGISISAPDYIFHSDRYTIPEGADYTEFTRDFPLEKLQKGETFVVNNIFFDYNTATLSTVSGPELERVSELMRKHPHMHVEVGGHTDNIGSARYNQDLSVRRAEAVRDYLVGAGGIDSMRVSVKGFGYTKPLASNETEEGRHQNRRSEFTVTSL